MVAGSPSKKGYVVICIDGEKHYAHRLAWLYMTGKFPVREVDHRNLVKSDNAFSNLRQANLVQNLMNRPVQARNSTGYKGVHFHKTSGFFFASIGVNSAKVYLGCHRDPVAAAMAYDRAAKKYFGPFARLNFPVETRT